MTSQQLVRRIIHWLLTLLIIVYLVTGFGITEYRIVESVTFGLLTKIVAFKLHMSLEVPLAILLILHMYFSLISRPPRQNILREDRNEPKQ